MAFPPNTVPPTIRAYVNGTPVQATDAFVIDRIGVGTMYVTGLGSATDAAAALAAAMAAQTSANTANLRVIPYVIDGGGAVISTGFSGQLDVSYLPALTIGLVSLLASPSGSCVIDIGVLPFTSYAAAFGGSITASAMPTLSAASRYKDTTLTGWTTIVPAGSVLVYNVVSASSITRLTISLGAHT